MTSGIRTPDGCNASGSDPSSSKPADDGKSGAGASSGGSSVGVAAVAAGGEARAAGAAGATGDDGKRAAGAAGDDGNRAAGAAGDDGNGAASAAGDDGNRAASAAGDDGNRAASAAGDDGNRAASAAGDDGNRAASAAGDDGNRAASAAGGEAHATCAAGSPDGDAPASGSSAAAATGRGQGGVGAAPGPAPRAWIPVEVMLHITPCLPDAMAWRTMRLVTKGLAAALRPEPFETVHFSQPVPCNKFESYCRTSGALRTLTLEQRRLLLLLTARSGRLPNFHVALETAGCLASPAVFEQVASNGHVDACRLLLAHCCPTVLIAPMTAALARAARAGNAEMCQWLFEQNQSVCSPEAVESAQRAGHQQLANWLRPRVSILALRRVAARAAAPPPAGDPGYNAGTDAAPHAFLFDLPSLGQQLWANAEPTVSTPRRTPLEAAAADLTPDWREQVTLLRSSGHPWTPRAAAEAAACPDGLDRLTWLREQQCPVDSLAADVALRGRNLPALNFLLSNGVKPSFAAVKELATGGHAALLRVLRAGGCVLDGRDLAAPAAFAGHLHVVAYLVKEAGAPLDAWLLTAAVRSGSVELVAWLRQRGCGWDSGTFLEAVRAGCEELLEWLVEQGCPMPADEAAYTRACDNGDLRTLRCLRRLGVPWGDPKELVWGVLDRALAPVLQCLHQIGVPFHWDTVVSAVKRRAGMMPGMHGTQELVSYLEGHLPN